MSRSRRRIWTLYAACAMAVMGAVAWISLAFLALESERRTADHETHHRALVGNALWRMESWMVPVLGREAARPWFEYQPYSMESPGLEFAPQPGDVVIPSPLLVSQPAWTKVHFQIDAAGLMTSPQLPTGTLREAAVIGCVSATTLAHTESSLDHVRALVRYDEVLPRVRELETREEALILASGDDESPRLGPLRLVGDSDGEDPLHRQMRQNVVDARNRWEWVGKTKATYAGRRGANNDLQLENPWMPTPEGSNFFNNGVDLAYQPVELGTLIPVWLGDGELFFFRRVVVNETELLQGIWFDWPKLKEELLAEVSDLFADADLVPLGREAIHAGDAADPVGDSEARGFRAPSFGARLAAAPAASLPSSSALASVPAELRAPVPLLAPVPGWTPAQKTLGLAWSAVLLALVATAIMLRSSLIYGEKRSNFASAVTHELRTPLTTFRMYSEMLASGMVKDEEQRQSYYRTLEAESGRLSVLVENVLAHARVEDGRAVHHRRRVQAVELIDRVMPPLQRRCAEAELALLCTRGDLDGAELDADVEAVGQILLNLVDNAAKYAPDGKRVELTVERHGAELVFDVRDYGPGIKAGTAHRVFRPFDRAGRDGDSAPGIGLGLSLSRGLARDHGGDLELCASEQGALFRLRLPLVG